MSVPVLYCWAQNWMWYLRCGLANAEWRGGSNSLGLLAMFCLMQPRTPLSCLVARHTDSSCSALWSPGSPGLFCQAAFQMGVPQHVLIHRAVLPEVQDDNLLVEICEGFVSPPLAGGTLCQERDLLASWCSLWCSLPLAAGAVASEVGLFVPLG